jgi:hypothetical protein
MKDRRFRLFLLAGMLLPAMAAHAQWVRTAGPASGVVQGFAEKGGQIFMATRDATVMRTTNGGAPWLPSGSGIGVVAEGVRTVYASGTRLLGPVTGTLYVSDNDGGTWSPITSGLSGATLVCFTRRDTLLLAGSLNVGTLKSTNNGTTWGFTGTIGSTNIRAMHTVGATVFAGSSGGGVFRSTNDGEVWTAVNTGLTGFDLQIYSLSSVPGYVLAGTATGVFRSTNSGGAWTASSTGMPANSSTYGFAFDGTRLYAATVNGVFVSTNSGTGWAAAGSGLPLSSAFPPTGILISGGALYLGTFGNGVFRSTDNGATWAARNEGFIATYVDALHTTGGRLHAGTQWNGAFHSTNQGSLWSASQGSPLVTTVPSITSLGGTLFASMVDGNSLNPQSGVFRSTDGGLQWQRLATGPAISTAVAVQSGILFSGRSQGQVSASTDLGATWSARSNGIPTNADVYTIEPVGSQTFAGTSRGVFVSTNLGLLWTEANTGIPASTLVYAVAFIDSNVFAGTSRGVYRAGVSGLSWTAVNSGLTSARADALIAVGTTLFAGNTGSVFVSTNLGNSWTRKNEGFPGSPTPNATVIALAADATTLYAGTAWAGVWRRPLSEFGITGVEEGGRVPAEATLEQNYPNPFNPSTSIRFFIPAAGDVSVTVHDLLGQTVATLADGVREAGWHQVQWDASAASSGVYFCRFESAGGGGQPGVSVQTRKLLLVR